MLMQEATPEMVEQWKLIWNEYKGGEPDAQN